MDANANQYSDEAFAGYNRYSTARELLPVSKHKLEILYSVDKFSCTVIIAETGSGKTTRNSLKIAKLINFKEIPQFLLEAGHTMNNKCIAVTLPRRMAAISVATRVSHEIDCGLGQEVGYHVRFDDRSSSRTLIKYVTDGIIIREMLQDPLLSRYSVIMVDDIHERTANSDILMGLLKKIRNKRPELKLIVSSATLDAEKIERYFNYAEKGFESNVLFIEGRVFPVDLFYLKEKCSNYVTESVRLAWNIHLFKKPGDVLVFLTGQEEIEIFTTVMTAKYEEEIKNKKFNGLKIKLCPLYANLSMENQMEIFDPTPPNTRKIVVSTNLAESSVTIDNIVYVIDCCFVKMKYYDFYKDYESLLVVPVSQASANQRAGRAGRVKAGECYRLCTKAQFEALYSSSTPEILRTKLDTVFLQLKSLGVSNLAKFDFLDTPSEDSIIRSLELLFSLHVIDMKGELTEEIGVFLSDLPIDTRLAVMLLNSFKEEFACSEEILILVSILSSGFVFFANSSPISILKSKKKFGAKEGDLITLINLVLRYRHIGSRNEKKKFCAENNINESIILSAKKIGDQLEKYLKSKKFIFKSAEDDVEAILRCITSAFFANVAQRQKSGVYKAIRNQEVLYLHPTSILTTMYPEWIIFYEIIKTGKFYMRECVEIDYRWLVELAPHFYQDNKTKNLEEKHKQEVINYENMERNQQPKNIEGDMEKWSHDKPRFNKILENLSENLDQGKIFKKPKDKKENEKNKNKSVLSFEYEDI